MIVFHSLFLSFHHIHYLCYFIAWAFLYPPYPKYFFPFVQSISKIIASCATKKFLVFLSSLVQFTSFHSLFVFPLIFLTFMIFPEKGYICKPFILSQQHMLFSMLSFTSYYLIVIPQWFIVTHFGTHFLKPPLKLHCQGIFMDPSYELSRNLVQVTQLPFLGFQSLRSLRCIFRVRYFFRSSSLNFSLGLALLFTFKLMFNSHQLTQIHFSSSSTSLTTPQLSFNSHQLNQSHFSSSSAHSVTPQLIFSSLSCTLVQLT